MLLYLQTDLSSQLILCLLCRGAVERITRTLVKELSVHCPGYPQVYVYLFRHACQWCVVTLWHDLILCPAFRVQAVCSTAGLQKPL